MQRVFSILFWGFLTASSIALFPVAVATWLLTLPFDRRKVVLHRFTCFWGSLYTWCNPAWPVEIDDLHKIRRDETYVMVANHQSLLDILVLFRLFTHFKWVSKVENFRVTPSLPALGRIAVALRTSVSELVEALDDAPALTIVRADERTVVERDAPASATLYESLAHHRAGRRMDPFELTVPGGAARREALTHEGEEFLIVLQGRVQLEHDGQLHDLARGDSVYFDATRPHRLVNPHKRAATVLCVFCEP